MIPISLHDLKFDEFSPDESSSERKYLGLERKKGIVNTLEGLGEKRAVIPISCDPIMSLVLPSMASVTHIG